jgi:hypothetical protein
MPRKTYVVLSTIDYRNAKGAEVRVEPGTEINDMPAESAAIFLGLGLIEPKEE